MALTLPLGTDVTDTGDHARRHRVVATSSEAPNRSVTFDTNGESEFRTSNGTTALTINNLAADGDPLLRFQLNSASKFSLGVNDGVGDKFRLTTTSNMDTTVLFEATRSNGAMTFGTNNTLTMSGAGQVGVGVAHGSHGYGFETDYTQTGNFAGRIRNGHDNGWGLQLVAGTGGSAEKCLDIVGKGGTNKFTVWANDKADFHGTELVLDADADTSITADTDDLVDLKVGGNDFYSWFTYSGAHANQRLNAPAGGDSRIEFQESSTNKYLFGYSGANNRFYMTTTDSDGGGTDADVWRIPDGQLTIDANSSWDDNVFDYVCEDCGKSSAKLFECCGTYAKWHDDVALMDSFVHGLEEKKKDVIGKMEKLGLVNTYGTLDTDKPELYVSMNKMPFFLMSGMAQMQKRIESLEAQLHG